MLSITVLDDFIIKTMVIPIKLDLLVHSLIYYTILYIYISPALNHCWNGFIASRIDFKIATLTYKAVHLKQPPCLAQHLKLKSMHLNTGNNDQLLLQPPSVGTNGYGHRATVWNKLPYKILNAPSVTLFRKKLKTLCFKTCSRWSMNHDGRALSRPEVY